MKLLRGLAALALALMLASTTAFAQVSPGTSPLPVVKGGTGAATASGARSNLQVDKFTGHGDSAYSIAASDRVVGTNATFTASRTWTLPAANAVNSGQALIVADFQGTVTGSNTLIIARAGSDTINGGTSVTINSANGAYLLWSDGSSKWTAQAIGSSAASGVSSVDGVTGAISTQAGSLDVTGSTLSSNVLSSRNFAATQDLSAFSVVRTLGYATAGDGGGATFKKTVANLQDSYVTAGTISAAGSGYTNGTYRNIDMSGGNGFNIRLNITISGGAITSVSIVQGGGNGYSVGDVLTTSNGNIGGTGSGFTWTVSTISTPQASFTDTAGNKWQYVPDTDIFIKQFGAKADWNGTDASATDDFTAIDAALKFGAIKTTNARADAGGSAGTTVRLSGGGVSKVCPPPSALTVYGTVQLAGAGMFSSGLKVCDSGLPAASHFVTLGDPNVQVACFGAKIIGMTLYATTSAAANSSIGMIFSNCDQQNTIVEQVAVYAGLRNCFRYTNGYGGAAKYILRDFFCTLYTASSNDGISLDPTTTVNQYLDNIIVEAGGSGNAGAGVLVRSGNVWINGYHTEGVATGVDVNLTVSTYQGSLRQATGGAGCSELLKLQFTNTVGNFIIGTSQKNGCTRLVTDGQPSGSDQSTDQVMDKVFTP
ncbi:hypothetical protein ACVWZK_006401 [Bradyrhizobium sp. GM0.4]